MRYRSGFGAAVLVVGVLVPIGAPRVAAAERTALSTGQAEVITIDAPAGPTDAATFHLIGASWTGGGEDHAEARVRAGGVWHEWKHLEVDAELGGEETPTDRIVAQPLWVGASDGFEVRLPDGASGGSVHLVRSPTVVPASSTTSASSSRDGSSPSASAASTVPGAPATFSRSAWGARAPKNRYFTTAKMAFVHHTAGNNGYSPGDVPAIIRGIQAYHMDANGWDDIAYNFLVDRFGRIWEGRGGLDRTVRGGHTGGFNTDSVGVAALGDFTKTSPSGELIGATADIVGWVLGRSGVDPLGTATVTAAGHGNSKFGAGQVVTLPAVSGHRDVSHTSCPGALYDALGAIRQRAAIRAAQANSPFGSIDSVHLSPGGIRVSGWVIDPNASSPSDVHIYVGSAGYPVNAPISRPDVAAVFGFGDRHGYSAAIPTPAGAHDVCVYGINVGPGGNKFIGCRRVVVTDHPIGTVDRIQRVPGGVEIAGWALDPNTKSSIDVHAYVGGDGVATTANRTRTDLRAYYPDYGTAHGYLALLPAREGRHRTCTYAINRGPGANVALGCSEINVAVSPFGSLDSARRTTGGLQVGGWAIDPDVDSPITVHIYADGSLVGVLPAASERRDVAAHHPRYGPDHGYTALLPAQPGAKRVCAYGINTGAGGNSLLGCRTLP